MTDVPRISIRPDFNDASVFDLADFDVPENAPGRTKDNRPWVRWARYGDYKGWYAKGDRDPVQDASARRTFWQATFAVACAVSGGNLDQAHCAGRGILSLGGLGVTARSGYAQLLLHECLVAAPERWLEVMAPLMKETGVYTRRCEQSPSGVAFYRDGKPLLTDEELRDVIALGSDSVSWSPDQKRRAHLWVERCSLLLRDDRMDHTQEAFACEVMHRLLPQEVGRAVRIPNKNFQDWWSYTPEQQALWAICMIQALEDEELTTALVSATVTSDPYSASATLAAMRQAIAQPRYNGVFATRFVSALPKICALLRVRMPEES